MNDKEFWEKTLVKPDFKPIAVLIESYLCIPVSSVECERAFSRMNYIKTEFRSSLNSQTLDSLMEISLNAPEISEFDFEKSITNWKETKERRFV